MMDQSLVTGVGDWHVRALKRISVSFAFVTEWVEFSRVDMGRRKGAKVDRSGDSRESDMFASAAT